MRWLLFFVLCALGVRDAMAHGSPSVAALVSREPGEPLVARFNLDLALFFEGKVEPDQAWLEGQSRDDLDLLAADLDRFLRARFTFSVEGEYLFPLLGEGGIREIAPGIELPDGHVMPVFTSTRAPGGAVSVSASDVAVPLVLVRETGGVRSRRSVVLFPGESRELFPAVVPEEPAGIDPALFDLEELPLETPAFGDGVREGWEKMTGVASVGTFLLFLALGCAVRDRRTFWAGCGSAAVSLIGGYFVGALVPEAGGDREFFPVWTVVLTAVVAVAGWVRPSRWQWYAIPAVGWGIDEGRVLTEGLGGGGVPLVLGAVAGFVAIGVSVFALVGWLWRGEKTPRALAVWGGVGTLAAALALATWRPFS